LAARMTDPLRHNPEWSRLEHDTRAALLDYFQKSARLAFLAEYILTATTAAGMPDPHDAVREAVGLARELSRM